MNVEIKEDSIIVDNSNCFEPQQILESGQMFRFEQKNGGWLLKTEGECAKIVNLGAKKWKIECKNPKYFVKYFDFETNYDIIQNELKKFEVCKKAVEYSWGVRILKQSAFETLVCFIISANNNITRIKKSVEKICEKFGSKTNFGFAFPTLQQLLKATESDFVEAGLGYRAKYLVQTLQSLNNGFDLEKLKELPTDIARKKLESLAGIGPKVADCILLFGIGKKDVFPVDTWIAKVWQDQFGGQIKNRRKISQELVKKFGDLSGICQQYMFYYKRQTKIKVEE